MHKVGFLVFFVSLYVYITSCARHVVGGDAADIVTSAYSWSVAHPPGYPLQSMLAHFVIHYLPESVGSVLASLPFPVVRDPTKEVRGDTVSFRAGITSSIEAAIANTLIYHLCARISHHRAAAVIAVSLFGLSPTIWKYSSSPEVFALNHLVCAGLLCSGYYVFSSLAEARRESRRVDKQMRREREKKRESDEGGHGSDAGMREKKEVIAASSMFGHYLTIASLASVGGALFTGMGLANQHTSVVFSIVIAFAMVWEWLKCVRTSPTFLRAAVWKRLVLAVIGSVMAVALCLSSYLYFISASANVREATSHMSHLVHNAEDIETMSKSRSYFGHIPPTCTLENGTVSSACVRDYARKHQAVLDNMSWGNHSTLDDILHHFFRRDYGTFQLVNSGQVTEINEKRYEVIAERYSLHSLFTPPSPSSAEGGPSSPLLPQFLVELLPDSVKEMIENNKNVTIMSFLQAGDMSSHFLHTLKVEYGILGCFFIVLGLLVFVISCSTFGGSEGVKEVDKSEKWGEDDKKEETVKGGEEKEKGGKVESGKEGLRRRQGRGQRDDKGEAEKNTKASHSNASSENRRKEEENKEAEREVEQEEESQTRRRRGMSTSVVDHLRWRLSHLHALPSIFASVLVYLLVFLTRANLPVVDHNGQPIYLYRDVVLRFWLQPMLALAPFIAVGVSVMFEMFDIIQLISDIRNNVQYKVNTFRDHRHRHTLVKVVKAALAAIIFALCFSTSYKYGDQATNHHAEKWGKALLAHLPPKSVLIAHGDLACFTLRYLTVVERFRDDVIVIEQELIGYEWMTERLRQAYDGYTHLPAGKLLVGWYRTHRDEQEGFILSELVRSLLFDQFHVFMMGVREDAKDPLFDHSFDMRPFGMVEAVFDEEIKPAPSVSDWYHLTAATLPSFDHSQSSHTSWKSWEYLAVTQAYSAIVQRAAFALTSSSGRDPALLRHVIHDLDEWFSNERGMVACPEEGTIAAAHKNMGIAIDRLRSISGELTADEDARLCHRMLGHFEEFVGLSARINSAEAEEVEAVVEATKCPPLPRPDVD